jgi:hypothetical protein
MTFIRGNYHLTMANENIKLNETNTSLINFLIHTSRLPFCIYTLSSKYFISFLYVQAKENNNTFSCVYYYDASNNAASHTHVSSYVVWIICSLMSAIKHHTCWMSLPNIKVVEVFIIQIWVNEDPVNYDLTLNSTWMYGFVSLNGLT